MHALDDAGGGAQRRRGTAVLDGGSRGGTREKSERKRKQMLKWQWQPPYLKYVQFTELVPFSQHKIL